MGMYNLFIYEYKFRDFDKLDDLIADLVERTRRENNDNLQWYCSPRNIWGRVKNKSDTGSRIVWIIYKGIGWREIEYTEDELSTITSELGATRLNMRIIYNPNPDFPHSGTFAEIDIDPENKTE